MRHGGRPGGRRDVEQDPARRRHRDPARRLAQRRQRLRRPVLDRPRRASCWSAATRRRGSRSTARSTGSAPRRPYGGFLGNGELLFLAGCMLGGVIAALVRRSLVGLPSLRLRGDYLAIVTLGFGEIVRVLGQITARQPKNVAAMQGAVDVRAREQPRRRRGLLADPELHDAVLRLPVRVRRCSCCVYRLKYSSKGRALLAVRENEIAAEAMGVNTTRVKVVAFVFAAFFAGIGGALYAHEVGTLDPQGARLPEVDRPRDHRRARRHGLDHRASCSARRSSSILPELFRQFADYRMIVYALALIVVMILRPQGIMGVKELWETSWWRRLARKLRAAGGCPPEARRDGRARARVAEAVARVRRPQGGQRLLARAAGRRAVRPDRPERRRQDHGVQPADRRLPARRRRRSSSAAQRIDGKKPSQIARAGIARTFQNIRLFGELSVLDNVRTAAGVRTRSGLFRTLLRTPLHVAEERAITERCARAARRARHRAPRGRAGQEPAVRRSAPARDRARARDRAQGAPARRAGRRHEHAGEARDARR